MDLIRDLEHVDPKFRGGVLSVGVFDGVHVGHQAVLGRTVERARSSGSAALAFTFHPHPLEVLRPAEAPPLIQTFGQKLERLRQIGLDATIWPERPAECLALSPETFVHEVVCGRLGARRMVEGTDFHFGAGKGAGVAQLGNIAQTRGLAVETVRDVRIEGERVSSTRIRRLIAEGRVDVAARCLGRPYTYVGTVVEGRHQGGRMGYPTVNLEAPRFLRPAEGVYAGRARVRGGAYMAAVSVGRAPTFGDAGRSLVEAFLLDFDGELYGEQLALEFHAHLRTQKRFADQETLKQQLAADCDRVRDHFARTSDSDG